MLISFFVLMMNLSQAQEVKAAEALNFDLFDQVEVSSQFDAANPFDVMFCQPKPGQGKTDLVWLQTFTRGSESSYVGYIKASYRSYENLSADLNQIEWVFKDITVPTKRLEDSSSYRLIYRESGWTLDEYYDEYQKTFVLDCSFSRQ